MVQYFKGDETELKYFACGDTISSQLSLVKNEFFEDAFNCFILGEVLYDTNLSPLSNAIARDIFREAFSTIFESFVTVGSFESYLTVFRKVFGEEVDVYFTIPAAGKLNIDIVATGLEIYGTLVREINDDQYDYFTLIDDEGDRIVLQAVKGFESQYELEQMLKEMVPSGIYTEISLTVGEA